MAKKLTNHTLWLSERAPFFLVDFEFPFGLALLQLIRPYLKINLVT